LFEFSNLVWVDWQVQRFCIAVYRDRGLKRVRKRETERRPVRREVIMLVTMREQLHVSEPIETKYLIF
jgi:hypothetical protein